MKKIIILSLLLSFFINSKSEELLGTIISYKALKPLKYKVTYTIYSDIMPNNINYNFSILKPFTFKVISGANSVLNFPTLIKTSTYYSGKNKSSFDMITYTFEDTINLNDNKYSNIISSGDCKIYFCFYYPERFKTLSNIAQSPYFTYSYTNICISSSNNSPENQNFNQYLPSNKNSVLSLDFVDKIDFDSLSYNFTNPQYGFDSIIDFNTGFSVNKPIVSKFLEINKDYGNVNIQTNDTVGNYNYTYQVHEYRKIGNANFEIGMINVDLTIKIIKNINSPPELFGPYNYTIEAGKEICFQINCHDHNFIPPPPEKGSPSDTVKLSWSEGIPDATFTIINPDKRLPSAKFCWTPKINQANELPYYFTVTAVDNFWLYNEKTTKTYSIKVVKPLSIVSDIYKNKILILPNPSSCNYITIRGVEIDEVKIINTSGKIVIEQITEPLNEIKINTQNLNAGLYIVQVKDQGIVYRQKWIKN
ncbi:MAG: T9SS type A sorting domain-containing protein [Bacteroidetes bacterium]|nr:T9SS type A sorting domain-containing protein [Bacteroidota bacterium]